MKIVFSKQKKPTRNEAFKNGHLYQHASQPQHGGVLYLCSCGYLVELPACNALHNIIRCNFKQEEFVDVTDQFELREITE